MPELLVSLAFVIGVLFLIERYLTTREDAMFSVIHETLNTLKTLVPENTRQVADAAVRIISPPQPPESPEQLVSRIMNGSEPEEEPFTPPWEVEVSPESVPKTGEWR